MSTHTLSPLCPNEGHQSVPAKLEGPGSKRSSKHSAFQSLSFPRCKGQGRRDDLLRPSGLVHSRSVTPSKEKSQGADRTLSQEPPKQHTDPRRAGDPTPSMKIWAGAPHTSHDQERPSRGRAQEVVSDALIWACISGLHSLQPQAPVRQGLEPPAGPHRLAHSQPLHRGHRLSGGLAPQGHGLPGSHCHVLGLHLEHRGTCGRPRTAFRNTSVVSAHRLSAQILKVQF